MGIVTVIVEDRLRVVDPSAALRLLLTERLTYANPDHAKAVRLDLWTIPPKFITNIKTDGSDMIVPRGATRKVREAAAADGCEVRFVDRRRGVPMRAPRTLAQAIARVHDTARITPSPRQLECVVALVKRENAYIQAPTGMGKTVILALALASAAQRALILVPDRGILSQTISTLLGVFDGKHVRELHGQPNVSERRSCRSADVVVGTYDMLWGILKRGGEWADEVRQGFGTIVTDEMHLVAAPTRICSVEQFPARFRWGCSATPTRHDKREFLLFDAFGSPADHVTMEEAIEEGRVIPAEIRIVPTDLHDLEYERAMLGGAPPTSARVRKKLQDMVAETVWKDPARNRSIVDLMLSEHAAGHSCLTLCRRLDHCEILLAELASRGHRCARLDGGSGSRASRHRAFLASIDAGTCSVAYLRGGAENREEFEHVREALRLGLLRLAVGSPKAFVGLDIPRLDRGIVATPVNNNAQLLEQMIGRFRRPHEAKRDAVVFYLWDRHVFPGTKRRIQKTYGDLVRVV